MRARGDLLGAAEPHARQGRPVDCHGARARLLDLPDLVYLVRLAAYG